MRETLTHPDAPKNDLPLPDAPKDSLTQAEEVQINPLKGTGKSLASESEPEGRTAQLDEVNNNPLA